MLQLVFLLISEVFFVIFIIYELFWISNFFRITEVFFGIGRLARYFLTIVIIFELPPPKNPDFLCLPIVVSQNALLGRSSPPG